MTKTERFAHPPIPASYDCNVPHLEAPPVPCHCWRRGRLRRLLALLGLAILIAPGIGAQQALDPDDDFIVVITPRIYDPNGSNTCATCCYPITCRRAMYQVSLKVDTENNYNGGDFELLYEQLSVTVQALIDPGNVSRLNVAETEACLNLDGPGYAFGVNGNDNSVTLFISGDLLGEMEELPVITFEDYESPVLFTLVVDCFPGEPTGAAHTDFLYVYDDTEIASASGGGPGAPATYPEPAGTNTDFTLSLGTPDCYDDFAVFPVLLTSAITEEIEYLDFYLEFATDKALAGQPGFDGILGGTSPDFGTPAELPGDGGYAYRVVYSGETLTGSGLTLFAAKVPTPVLLSAGYDIVATLRPGRLVIDDECDKPAIGNDEEQCTEEAVEECESSDDYTVIVQTETNPVNDCELSVYIYFEWDNSLGSTETFKEIDLLVEFDLPPDVTMTDIYTSGITIPGDNTGAGITPSSPGGNTIGFSIISTTGITLTATNSVIVVVFEAPTGCIKKASIRRAALKEASAAEPCLPERVVMAFPYCTPLVQGNIVREDGCYVDEVTVDIEPDPLPTPPEPLCQQSLNTTCATYSACVCPTHTDYKITPLKDNDPLNGVSTFDLVLIQKHVLGLEPLNSPYKIIAADANKSGSVTTFDIVELRKLILGQYEEFSEIHAMQTSWRFVQLEYEFPNEENPFSQQFPESITDELPVEDADFVAIKVGDVNNNAIVCAPPCNGPQSLMAIPYPFSISDRAVKAGEYLTVPLVAAGEIPLVAFQLTLHFDPRMLEFAGPSAGDVPGMYPDNFGLTRISEGIMRLSWMARPGEEEELLQTGQRACLLTFRAKRGLKRLGDHLRLDDGILPARAWTETGAEYALLLQADRAAAYRDPEAAANTLPVQVRPNPAGGAVSFHFKLPESSRTRLSVYDAYGVRVLYRDLELPAGKQALDITEAAGWPAGVYNYDLRAGSLRAKGRLIRQ